MLISLLSVNIFQVYHLPLHDDLDTQKYFMYKPIKYFFVAFHPEVRQILIFFSHRRMKLHSVSGAS